MENDKNMEIILNRFGDVVELNAFVASRPKYAVLTYKTSKHMGLWELEIDDKRIQWIVGYNISGLEDIALEHSIEVQRRRYGYVDAKLVEQFQELFVVRWKSGYIFVTLPNESMKRITIAAPQVCGRGIELMEPVYIWKDTIEWYYVLDCSYGKQIFETLSDLETWLYEKTEGRKLPWNEWYVVEGVVNDEDEWIDAIKRAVMGELGPAPHEVVKLVRRLTE